MNKNVKIEDMTKLTDLQKELFHKPQLSCLFFELTNKCNLSCLHCGSNACPGNEIYLPFELVEKVLLDVSSKYNSEKIMVCLTGGEPMLHPDIYRIIKRARELGFFCGITSNAMLIDDEAIDKLKASGLQSISVSLDGLQKEHDELRNKKGAFDSAVAGIKRLVECKTVYTQITTVVSKKNLHILPQMLELAQELEVDSWRPINIEPIGRARNRKDLLLDKNEFKELIDFIVAKRFDPKVLIDVTFGCSHYLSVEYERMTRDNYFICGAGLSVGSVLCNGDIYACPDIERRPELIQGNVYNESFTEIWENKFKEFRTDRTVLNQKCLECSERTYCRGDATHTWDFDSNEPLFCIKDYF